MAAAAAAEAGQAPKWEGRATAKLLESTPDKVWSLLQDFCGFSKWLPGTNTSYKVSGADGQPGLVRYFSAAMPPPDAGGEAAVNWCHERLVDIDPIGRRLTYEVLDNNIGLRGYRSTLKVVPINGGDETVTINGGGEEVSINGGDEAGCEIEWSFVADPVEGLSCEFLVGYIDATLQGLAINLDKA